MSSAPDRPSRPSTATYDHLFAAQNTMPSANETAFTKADQRVLARPSTSHPSQFGLSWRAGSRTHVNHGHVADSESNDVVMIDEDATTEIAPTPFHQHGHHRSASLSFKGKIRRASLSLMKGFNQRRGRRSSEPAVEGYNLQPSTSSSTWTRLRSATTFRHSKLLLSKQPSLDPVYAQLESSYVTDLPIPGNGAAPPIIPANTGAAAKAAAAMQNEYLAFERLRQEEGWQPMEGVHNDSESGIGINLTPSDSDVDLVSEMDFSVPRTDFIAHLPVELVVQVLSYLDAAQLNTAARVSRRWYQTVMDQHIWRQSFLREMTQTYATGNNAQPGTGCGVPPIRQGSDWRRIYQARHELERQWKTQKQARATYLNGHLDSIYCLQFDENKIITGSRDKTIRIWDMHLLQCRLIIGPPEVVNQTNILFDPNGKPLHYASGDDNERSCPSVPVTVSFPIHHKASILCLQYDDEILVTGSSDSSCIVYNVRSGYRPVRRLEHHTAAVLDLAFDRKHIVTCSKDITICVWDRATGALIKQLTGHTGPVNAVQLRDNTIVSCSGDFRVKLWNLESGKVVREFMGHTKGLACSQFSEDGRYIASAGSDKVIRIWDANTGECIREIQAHDSLVRSLHIDSVSGRLVSGSYDTDIKVFDMETGEQVGDFPRRHASWVLSAKSDYRRIVSTGQDPKILILDFGADVRDIQCLESSRKRESVYDAGFI
ncbi:quinon protein alcohol dehydrogenase-like superfamily [Microdochium bolleyi]|uniref:Quinon protein alcohol dehydrogenase-like superfamily n=1 Tax=Microdochium bolleyi TaxID=196109 RepID=A0A136JAU8_9PEZI|nr:quinon protein alcohol dehydrogenase-like superfamily [Microdochium bolleyi]